MGLGYIGLPTAIIAARSGIDIIGVDTNKRVVDLTNQGKLHMIEPCMEPILQEMVKTGKLRASSRPETADAFFIMVPTPFKANHKADVSYVGSATRAVVPYLQEGNLFVIESTLPVGTTDAIAKIIYTMRPELEGHIYIAYCPERVLPGNVLYELEHNDRVIGGITPEASEKAAQFYARFVTG